MVSAGRDITGAVVVGDHSLAITAGEGSLVTVLPPGQVPRPVRRKKIDSRPRQRHEPIVGRADILGKLSAAVRAGRPVQLHGQSGVGKSTILRHAAAALPSGQDGVVFLSAMNAEIRDVAQQLFEACYETAGYAPTGAELRHLMTGIRITAYIDNANFSGEQLREFMDMAPNATFAFASREPTLRGQGTVLEVAGLDLSEGLYLLAQEVQRPLTETGRAAAIHLWEQAQGSPLLLVQAAGLARSGPSGEAVLPRPSTVAEITQLLLETVDEVGQAILRLLASLDGAEIAAAHIGALTGATNPARACDSLAGLGLLMTDENLYRCPPEVLPVIRGKYPEPFPADQLCRHFATWAANRTTTPDQVARHAAAIAQAALLAEEAGYPELAVRAARAASPSMARALRFGPWGLLLGRGWSAARACGDKRAEAYFTHEEGVRAKLTGRTVIGATLIGVALGMIQELGGLHHVPSPTGIPMPPQVALPPVNPVSPVNTASAGSASAPPPVTPAPGGSGTTGIPSSGGTHAVPVSHAPMPQAGMSHVAVSHAGSAHATAVASHMTQLVHSPGWPTPLPQPLLPVPAVPVPSMTPAPLSGIGPVLTKVFIAAAVLAGMAGARLAMAHTFSTSTSVFSSTSPPAVNSSYSDSFPSPSTDPQPTGLAGTWQNASNDNTFTITAVDNDTYTFQDSCQATVTLTRSGSIYTGKEILYDESDPSGCGQIGYVTVTFTLDPGGQQMVEVATLPPGETNSSGDQLECYSCGTFTFARVPGL
ncbi:MAG: hypothetical protein JO345_33305 [Streptosporangiaceae bacterium]|nr:hypothetical protein [Streptosporangiaceae bacterium]